MIFHLPRAAAPLTIVVALLWPALALAGLTATSTMLNVVLTATDLTPGDANAAGVDVLGASTLLTVLVADNVQQVPGSLPLTGLAPGNVEVALDSASATMQTPGGMGALSGQATALGGVPGLSYALGRGSQNLHLLLQPYSLLTVTGHALLGARFDGPLPGMLSYQGLGYYSVEFFDGVEQRYTEGFVQLDWTDPVGSVGLEEDFTLTYANRTGQERELLLLLGTLAEAQVLSVPEPSMPVLLVAGLLVLAGLGRRRARSSRRLHVQRPGPVTATG